MLSSPLFHGSFDLSCERRLIWNRGLGRGNPHPAAIGADFGRLGIGFWPAVDALDVRNERRRESLQELVDWRNAIAHQDFEPVSPGESNPSSVERQNVA